MILIWLQIKYHYNVLPDPEQRSQVPNIRQSLLPPEVAWAVVQIHREPVIEVSFSLTKVLPFLQEGQKVNTKPFHCVLGAGGTWHCSVEPI